MMKIVFVLAAILGAAAAAAQDRTISAGFGVSNTQCGTAEAYGSISLDVDSDDVPMHFDLAVGPNGGCDGQGTSINAQVAKRLYYNSGSFFSFVAGGYDRGVAPHEFVDPASGPFKLFRGFTYEQVQALVGLGYDCGDNCSVRVSYDAVETKKANGDKTLPIRLAVSYRLAGSYEFDANTDFTLTELNLRKETGVVVLRAGVTFGAHKLQNDAAEWGKSVGYVPAGFDDPIYNVGFEFEF